MKRTLCSLLLLSLLHPAFAQRKYAKVENGPMTINTTTVAGGSFVMGSDNDEKDRMPAHNVAIKDFKIGTYEITQAQWKAVMGTNPSTYECDKCPVNNVSWTEVQTFIEKLNSMSGKHYRLPTEAEWEYAAGGGVNARNKTYSGKNFPQRISWNGNNSRDRIHEIGMKEPNEIGLYDMSGNVEEWCADFYAPNYGGKSDVENPQGPASGNAHVVRGGSWKSDPKEMSVTSRAGYVPGTHSITTGFRVVED